MKSILRDRWYCFLDLSVSAVLIDLHLQLFVQILPWCYLRVSFFKQYKSSSFQNIVQTFIKLCLLLLIATASIAL